MLRPPTTARLAAAAALAAAGCQTIVGIDHTVSSPGDGGRPPDGQVVVDGRPGAADAPLASGDAAPTWEAELCPPNEGLTTDFPSQVLPAGLAYEGDPSTIPAVVGGCLSIVLPSDGETVGRGGIATSGFVSLDERRTYIKVGTLLGGESVEVGLELAADPDHVAAIVYAGYAVRPVLLDGSPDDVLAGIAHPFDPTSQGQATFWQLRESAGTLVWEVSYDGAIWHQLAAVPSPAFLGSVTLGVYAELSEPTTVASSACIDAIGECAVVE